MYQKAVFIFLFLFGCTRTSESESTQTAPTEAPLTSALPKGTSKIDDELLACYKLPKGKPKTTHLMPGDQGYDDATIIDCMECNTPVVLLGFNDHSSDPFVREANDLRNRYWSAAMGYTGCYFALQHYLGRRDPGSLGFGKYKSLSFSEFAVARRADTYRSVFENATVKMATYNRSVPGFDPGCLSNCRHHITVRYRYTEDLRELNSTILSPEFLEKQERLGYHEVYTAWEKATNLGAKAELKRELCRVISLFENNPFSTEQITTLGACPDN